MTDLTGESRESLLARRDRLQGNLVGARNRGDLGTAKRIEAMLIRTEEALRTALSAPPTPEPAVKRPAAPPPGDPEAGQRATLVTGAGKSIVVHQVTGPRRILCRGDRPLVAGTKMLLAAGEVTCIRCRKVAGNLAAREAAVDTRPAPTARPDSPERRTGGLDEGKSYRVTEPLPPLDPAPAVDVEPTEAFTAGDLAALLLGCAIDAAKPLRVIGRLGPSSTVGAMVSADGSLVLMAVD